MKFTENQLGRYASPIGQSEQEKCKHAFESAFGADLSATGRHRTLLYVFVVSPVFLYLGIGSPPFQQKRRPGGRLC
jgi:hypothetical protein